MLGSALPAGTLHEVLKDGIALCNLIKRITGEASSFPHHSRAPFVQMENIAFFIEKAAQLGVPGVDNFVTVDLFEGKGMRQVLLCLESLSRHIHKSGCTRYPIIGPRLIDPQTIEMSKEKIDDAQRAVSLQYGYMPVNKK